MQHTARIAAGIVFLMALMSAPAAAQRPGLPSDYQPPPTPSTGQQPPPGPGQPGRPGPAKGKDGKDKDKNKLGDKLGPITVFPLQHLYFANLGAPTATEPASDDMRVFVALKNGAVGAWKVEDGALVWAVDKMTALQPLVTDSGRLYVALDGEVAALDNATGKALWRVPSGGSITAPPIAKAGWLILGFENGDLHALRGETGELVWQANLGATIKTRPVIVGDRLYVAAQNHLLVAFDLVSGGRLWSQEFDGPVVSIGAQGERVFISSNRMFFALDHAGHIKWKRRVGADVIGQPVTDASTVYAAFTDNTLLAFGTGGGDLRWRAPLTYRPVSGPTRADDTLLLCGIVPIVHGYDAKDGKPAPDFNTPADPRVAIVAAPMWVHGRTFFQDTVLTLYAHGWIAAARRVGPGTLSPFSDPGTPCPPIAMPGEAPPPTATATPAPPKA